MPNASKPLSDTVWVMMLMGEQHDPPPLAHTQTILTKPMPPPHPASTYHMRIVGSSLGFVSAVFPKSPLDTVAVLLVPRVNVSILPGAAGTCHWHHKLHTHPENGSPPTQTSLKPNKGPFHTHMTHLMSIVGSSLGFVKAVFTKSPFATVGVLLVPRVNTSALPGAAGTASRSFCMLYGPMNARLYS